jgi:N-acyl-D-amino-acid deacylase
VRTATALVRLLAAASLIGVAARAAVPGPEPVDLLIRGGRIVDGTGNPWYVADVAVSGDTIRAIGRDLRLPATRVIDASGLAVSPGFIDVHTHARRGIFEVPTADNYVRQGVTTLIEGPDGSSALPVRPFLEKVAAAGIVPNFGTFVGQGSVRTAVMGEEARTATPEDLARMSSLVRQGMEDGAFGLSTGLFYVPGTFTPTAEVVALARVAGRMGGIHISHMRDEAAGVVDSVRETIAIGEQGELPTQVTHHKVIGRSNWGKSVETLQLVDEARARGVDVTLDQYPYTASSTSIQAALLPAWILEGGRQALLQRLAEPTSRAKARLETIRLIREERGGGDPANVVMAHCEWDESLSGRSLADLTRAQGQEPTVENAAETTLWIVEKGGCQAIFHAMAEDDLVRILRHPATMVASDGEVTVFGRAHPHPRSYGTFARVLAVYVREKHVLGLEEAVRKMTALPAQRLGLPDRGLLKPGMKADLAIWDPSLVRDLATFERPHQYAQGVAWVIVNGRVVYETGSLTAARPGRVLYGPAYFFMGNGVLTTRKAMNRKIKAASGKISHAARLAHE